MSDFLAIEAILREIFIILAFQRVLLSKIWSSGSQLIASGSRGSKHNSQQVMKKS
jgi:hypothetical protein